MEKNNLALNGSETQGRGIDNILYQFSPLQLFRNFKLYESTKLLKTTDFTREQIAYVAGFQNAKVLTERFYKRYGITPTLYRQTSQG